MPAPLRLVGPSIIKLIETRGVSTFPPKVRIFLSGSERSRRKRALRKAGLRCFNVRVLEAELELALTEQGFSEVRIADRKTVEAELSAALIKWFEI